MQAALKKIIDFDSDDFVNNPYPTYHQLHQAGPYWLDHNQTNSSSKGMWLFGRYDDVSAILKESVSISKRVLKVRPEQNVTPLDYNMLNQDPPDHTRLRNLVSNSFSLENIKRITPRIEGIVDDLIAKMKAKGEADFVKDFAGQLPMIVIADFMGVPFEDHLL